MKLLEEENYDLELRIGKFLAIAGIFLFPFVLFPGFWRPVVVSKVFFIFIVIEFLLFLFLIFCLKKHEVYFRKSYISTALLVYLGVIFVSSIAGEDFTYSFWSTFSRGTGIATWLHYFIFFFLVSVIFKEERDWRHVFRALTLSSYLVALGSFLGINGLGWKGMNYFVQGGSFFNNTSYNGAYLLLAFFFILVGVFMENRKDWRALYFVSLFAIFFNPDLFNFSIFTGKVGIIEALENPSLFLGLARTSTILLWLGVILAILLLIFHKIKNKKTTIILASSLLILFLGIYIYGLSSLIRGDGIIYEKYRASAGIARPIAWGIAVEGIKERPLLGHGLENFSYVYQDRLDPRLVTLEAGFHFDDPHNYTLSQFLEVGTIGALSMLIVFAFIVFVSFKYYLKEKQYYLLFIPFIFFIHFLQMQTFFEAYNTLFLTFLILAFLVYKEPILKFKIPHMSYLNFYQIAAVILLVTSFFFFVYFPLSDSRFLYDYLRRPEKIDLGDISRKMKHLTLDPVETLSITSKNFSDFSIKNMGLIHLQNLFPAVEKEGAIYLETYRNFYPKYSHNFVFLLHYADFAGSAYFFDLDTLKEGEKIAREALQISSNYPQPYLILAANLYYQNRYEEAITYAQKAQEIDHSSLESESFLNRLKARNTKGKSPVVINLFGF